MPCKTFRQKNAFVARDGQQFQDVLGGGNVIGTVRFDVCTWQVFLFCCFDNVTCVRNCFPSFSFLFILSVDPIVYNYFKRQ